MNAFPTRVSDTFGGEYVIRGSIRKQWYTFRSLRRRMARVGMISRVRCDMAEFATQHGVYGKAGF